MHAQDFASPSAASRTIDRKFATRSLQTLLYSERTVRS